MEELSKIVVYDRYIVTDDTPKTIQRALKTAPKGMVIPEPADDSDRDPSLKTFYIHDMVSCCLIIRLVLLKYDSTRWPGLLPF